MNKSESKDIIPVQSIESAIYVIRGVKVIFDRNLAFLYGIQTKVLNQAVARNIERFPGDFMFQLTKEELENWRSHFVTSNPSTKMSLRHKPYVFTEHGAVMAANLLKSDRAIQMSVEIVRTFIKMRDFLASQKEFVKELQELRNFTLKHSNKTDREFRRIWQAIEKLSNSPKSPEEDRQIGFNLN